MTEPAGTPQHLDPEVGQHLAQLQDRWGDFQRVRRESLQREGMGGMTRIINEYVTINNKSAYELMLRGMLSSADKELLRTDRKFTEAWQIFVELRWPIRLLIRGLILFAGTVFVLVVVGGLLWAVFELVVGLTSGRK